MINIFNGLRSMRALFAVAYLKQFGGECFLAAEPGTCFKSALIDQQSIRTAIYALLSVCFSAYVIPVHAEGAKSLFYRQLNSIPKHEKNIGLTYSIELIRDGQTALVDNRYPFASGDQLRFHVQSNIDGYLYILMKQGSRGDSGLLFPAPGSDENNHVAAGKDTMVPAKGVIEFDQTAGTETIKLVLSPTKLHGDPSRFSRGIVIVPKQNTASKVAECMIEFACKDSAQKAVFKSSNNLPRFQQEPAVAVVSTDLSKPLAVEMQLHHAATRGIHAGASITQHSSRDDKTVADAPLTEAGRGSSINAATVKKVPSQSVSHSRVVEDKWAVIVGISDFKNPRWNLMYPAKDAQDFASFLIKEGHFAPDHVKVLVNAQATRENILNTLGAKWLPRNAKPGDIVLIYMATHGTSAEQDVAKKNFLVAYDTDPANAFATGIELQDLARTIKRRLNSDRIIIVLDTCHSGSVEPGAKALFPPQSFSFEDLVQGTGQLVIGSAADNQIAHDSLRYKNGIFTKHFIDGLRQNKKLADAFAYTQKKVEEESKADFHHPQIPVLKDAEWKGSGVVLAVPPVQPRPAAN